MIWIIVENSMEFPQIVWIYYVMETELKHIADTLYSQWLLIDYEVNVFNDVDDLNMYLRSEVILPDDE